MRIYYLDEYEIEMCLLKISLYNLSQNEQTFIIKLITPVLTQMTFHLTSVLP